MSRSLTISSLCYHTFFENEQADKSADCRD